MRAPIARIRISAGNPGWYDPLTNIHLTIARPEALVYEGSNVTNIKQGIAYKLVNVVEGSLEKPVAINEEVREVIPQEIETVKEEEPIVEEKIEETSEPVIEETTEEVVEEPKKKTTRKKATKKETSEDKPAEEK